MKRQHSLLLAAVAAATLAASCGTLVKTSAAILAGKAVGKAINAIYAAVKNGGILSLTDSENVGHLTTIAKNIQDLGKSGAGSDYAADFAKGLVSGSGNLISSANSAKITGALCSLAGVPAVSKLAESTDTASPLTLESAAELLSGFKSLVEKLE